MKTDRESNKERRHGGDNEMVMRQMSSNTSVVPQVSPSH